MTFYPQFFFCFQWFERISKEKTLAFCDNLLTPENKQFATKLQPRIATKIRSFGSGFLVARSNKFFKIIVDCRISCGFVFGE